MDWQPIETAPRDGTRFLAYIPRMRVCNAPWSGEFIGLVDIVYRNTDGTDPDEDCWEVDDYISVPGPPTHWMPLPAPPTEKGGAA